MPDIFPSDVLYALLDPRYLNNGGGGGAVLTINTIGPDGEGNVELTPGDIGAEPDLGVPSEISGRPTAFVVSTHAGVRSFVHSCPMKKMATTPALEDFEYDDQIIAVPEA